MYLSIGQKRTLPTRQIVGIFDMDNVTWSHRTRAAMDCCQRSGGLVSISEDLPRSIVVASPRATIRARRAVHRGANQRWYLSPLSCATLQKRAEEQGGARGENNA